ncbi:MAG TPA: helix-turn-helix transcriptional regulator, partial [Caldilineaceae bacterium]|nr:helix-turn-helix transcriptional regulator [Caldilineaceae bacterium]
RNRRYSYAEVAEKSGLTRQGVRRLLTEQTLTIRVDTLARLLDFFRAEGLDITLGDLFTESET